MLGETKSVIKRIDSIPFEITPNAYSEINANTRINFNYHSGLLKLREGDAVEIKFFLNNKPVNTDTYTMSGIIYETNKTCIKCSFGGLLMEYEGENNEEIAVGTKVHVTIQKV